MKLSLLVVMFLFFLSSCAVIKEYEKVNINDPDMVLGERGIDLVSTTFQSYREGATGANGGKTGGGCGCN